MKVKVPGSKKNPGSKNSRQVVNESESYTRQVVANPGSCDEMNSLGN